MAPVRVKGVFRLPLEACDLIQQGVPVFRIWTHLSPAAEAIAWLRSTSHLPNPSLGQMEQQATGALRVICVFSPYDATIS
jgi:hypothetical protein